MPLTAEQLVQVNNGLTAIDMSLALGQVTEPAGNGISAPLAQPTSILNNVAYHDYHRIELGTPVITQKIPDQKLAPKLKAVLDLTATVPWMFSPPVLTSAPSDAEQVEELISDMKQDLANMAAGPVPPMVQIFAIEALSDYIEQALWTAMSPGERDRLGQLASLWSAFTGRTLGGSTNDQVAPPGIAPPGSGGGITLGGMIGGLVGGAGSAVGGAVDASVGFVSDGVDALGDFTGLW